MRIIHLTDIHGTAFLIDEISSEIKNSEVVIISGDITHFGKKKETIQIIKKIKKYNSRIFAVTGNCDFSEVDEYLTSEGLNLHNTLKYYDNVTFFGIGGSLPCPGTTPNEYTEEKVMAWLSILETSLDNKSTSVFVPHQPPFNTKCDLVNDDNHVGSKEIRNFIEKNNPSLCLTGHIHEGIGIELIGNCSIINPGPFRTGKYAIIDLAKDGSSEVELKQITA